MEYINVKQAAEQWGISDRRVRLLCEQEKVEGVIKQGRTYLIPSNAVKPVDGRKLKGREIQSKYIALFSRIDAFKGELNKRRPFTSGELKRLQEEFIVEFTYNSNAIEGNTLTLKETAMVLEGITIDQKPLKDHLEAVGHRDAFFYVQQIINDKTPFSEKVIKDIHALVLMDRPDDKGTYRRIPVKIMGAYHEPPQPYLVPIQMEQLVLEFESKKLHPIESVALFHLLFEGIHPFIDGNGRTGRLILNFTLMQNGYPSINVKFSDRRKYYECFDAYYKDGNSEPMVKLIAGYVEERLTQYLEMLKE